jgi:hypothetical protein
MNIEMDVDQEGDSELYMRLSEEWARQVTINPVSRQFIQDSVSKKITGKHSIDLVAFFNKKLDINRFFIEDSDGKTANDGGEMPSVEFGANK